MKKEPRLCSVEGCDRKHFGKGFCQLHYERERRGVPLDAPPRNHQGIIGYRGMHHRIKKTRGPASDYDCACGCGREAREWALIPETKETIVDRLTGKLYSLNVDDYMPLAIRCHRELDGNMPPQEHRFTR